VRATSQAVNGRDAQRRQYTPSACRLRRLAEESGSAYNQGRSSAVRVERIVADAIAARVLT